MTSTAQKFDFQPREGLRRSLAYRPQVKWVYRSVLCLAAVFAVASAARIQSDRGEAFAFFVSAIFAFGSAWAFLRPMATFRLDVLDDHFVFHRNGQSFPVSFADVKGIGFFSARWVPGSFALRLNDGRRFWFTAALERSEYMLEALAAARPELLRTEGFMNHRSAAVVADHSWARFYDAFLKSASFAFDYLLFPCAAIGLALGVVCVWASPAPLAAARFSFALLALNLCLGLIIFSLNDLKQVIRRRALLKENPHAVRRDVTAERQDSAKGRWIRMTVFLAVVIAASSRLVAMS